MTCRFPILDDNEKSPNWDKHKPSDMPIVCQPRPQVQPFDRSGSGRPERRASEERGPRVENGPSKKSGPSETAGSGCMWIILVIVIIASVAAALMVRHHRNAEVSKMDTAAFSEYAFYDSLKEGDCFSLGAFPSFSTDGNYEDIEIRNGEKFACDDIRAQYRFIGKDVVAAEDADVEEFDGVKTRNFDNGDSFTYTLLARTGLFLVIDWSNQDDYRFVSIYLPEEYVLPSNVKNGGVIHVKVDGYDSCIDGSINVIDGHDTCWILSDIRSGAQ